MNAPVLVFDIETIPDISHAKHLYAELAELPDDEALPQLLTKYEEETGKTFLPLPLHRVACLSVLWVQNDKMTLKSLALPEHNEAEILNKFFTSLDRAPTLVSWNGRGFDLPVMTYRALHHGISAGKLFSQSGEMKYNNYQNRYHNKHIDLMMRLAAGSTLQKLDVVASLCGFAGKQDITGYDVLPMVQAGEWQKLTTYCESDVINTWLVYLRYQRLLGQMDGEQLAQWEAKTRDYLHTLKNTDGSARHDKFLDAWGGVNQARDNPHTDTATAEPTHHALEDATSPPSDVPSDAINQQTQALEHTTTNAHAI